MSVEYRLRLPSLRGLGRSVPLPAGMHGWALRAPREGTSMGSATLDRLNEAGMAAGPSGGQVPRPRRITLRQPLLDPMPDEPLAVVAVGAHGSGRGAVVGALLGSVGPVVDVPASSFLVVQHGHGRDLCAYLPGARQAHPYRSGTVHDEPVLARPPRRVEVSLPDPLLRHFALVDTPDTETLGVAGSRVLLDAVERGGAVMFVLSADRLPGRFELDLLAEVAQTRAAVFFVVTPRADGTWLPPRPRVATAPSASRTAATCSASTSSRRTSVRTTRPPARSRRTGSRSRRPCRRSPRRRGSRSTRPPPTPPTCAAPWSSGPRARG